MEISLLINMKMPTIVGIFILISRENFMLSCVEHENSFITSGPDQPVQMRRLISAIAVHISLKDSFSHGVTRILNAISVEDACFHASYSLDSKYFGLNNTYTCIYFICINKHKSKKLQIYMGNRRFTSPNDICKCSYPHSNVFIDLFC